MGKRPIWRLRWNWYVSRRAKRWGSQHWVFSAVKLAIAAYSAWLWFHVPAPGRAVAVLAAVAAAMSIHGEMKGWQKAIWMVLIGFLLCIEIRAIDNDRQQNQNAQAQMRQEDRTSFQHIADSLKDSLTIAKGQYDSTISHVDEVSSKTEGVATLAEQNLDSISGKDSYPCIVPQSHAVVNGSIPLALHNRGKNNLTGVQVQILSPHAFTEDIREFYKPGIDLGTVNPIWPKPLPNGIIPELDTSGIAGYTFFIWTQNGFYSEVINFRANKNGAIPWAYQYWLFKREVFDHATSKFPKGAQVSMPMKDCQQLQWSDDLGDGQLISKP